MSDEIEIDVEDLERRMDGALASLKQDYASLRTGRATASMLDPVTVDAYGVDTPINQVGTINVPEPRMLTLAIWDKAMVGKVDKAIRASGLGLNPVVDGTLIRLPIPELNEERRRDLAKLAGQYSEAAKVAADRRALDAIVTRFGTGTYATTRTEARDCTAAEDAYYAEMDNS